MTMINRRQALKRIGGLAGMASMSKLLSACGSDGDGGPVGITTYVYVMLENRTYDHLFGARKLVEGLPGDGLTSSMSNPDLNGNPIAPYEPENMVQQLCVPDPPHGWSSSRVQWNSGANDGFVRAHQEEHGVGHVDPMSYLTRKFAPISWALADEYTICDRWFSSIMGPTLPNRFYWHAGTSAGYRSNQVLDNVSNIGVPTIYHRLRDKNVEWAYYYASLPVVAALGNFVAPYNLEADYIQTRVRRFGDSEFGAGQFFTDAKNGTLPPVTYIDPFFYLNDDHPPAHPLMAQQLLSAIYTALANSPQWKNCMLVVTYDEHGGFYDHVSPPTTADDTLDNFPLDENGEPATGFEQLGFRVPALVAGPYVKRGHVSSVQYDHTSALKQLINTFELENLNARTAAANDLMDCIDLERLAAGDWAEPIDLPAIEVLTDASGNRTGVSVDGEVSPWDARCEIQGASLRVDPISETANRRPELFAGYDLRDSADTYLRSIDTFLRTHQSKRRP